MGRPTAKIDPAAVIRLARIHCTTEEIASALGCSVRTLERRFAASMKKGRELGRKSLRRLQWKTAKGGNPTMQIWLGKQLLGQTDKTDHTSGGKPVQLAPIRLEGDKEL